MYSMALRQKPRISYYEPEEPNLDEYVFCDKCADFVYEYCSIHGSLLVVPDDKVPKNHNFPSFVPRAALTIPHIFLHLAPSVIPGAGIGVFSTLTLPRGVRFGPYRGSKTYEIKSMYCWQIYDSNNKPSHVVDAADGNNSNWMRYVNCARHWREQNLVAFQYQGQLYYRTIKTIPRFTELMVFYGSEFANALHIDLRRYNSPPGYAQKFGVPLVNKPKTIEKGSKEDTKKRNKEDKIDSPCLFKQQKLTAKKESPRNISSDIKINIPEAAKQITLKGIHTDSNTETFVGNDCNKRFTSKHNLTCLEHKSELVKTPLAKQNVKHETKNTNNTSLKTSCAFKVSDDPEVKLVEHVEEKRLLDHTDSYERNQSGNLETHIKTYTEKKSYACDICNFKTKHKSSLKEHMRVHTGEKPFACDICHYKCKRNSNLKTHMRLHTGEKPFACDICHYKCTQKGTLKTHMRLHTGEKPFACDICHYKCREKGYIKTHMRLHTGEKPFACDICHYKCREKCNLKTHMRLHTGEKPFACDICHYKCTQKGTLKTHMRLHTGEKPFACDICHYKCREKGYIKTHMRLHTGEKPFACDICHYKCREKCNLKTHMRLHTGEKPFACDICHYKCKQISHLKTHMRVHRGEKPFACDICHYKCKQKCNLKTHMRLHTGEKPFACDICKYKSNRRNNLKSHLKIHIKN